MRAGAGEHRTRVALRTVAIVGSFRRHYGLVVEAARVLEDAGLRVISPAISQIINPGATYVRFASDAPDLTDHHIQAVTMGRILSADAVYVVAPKGYIGRMTSYELGRVHEKGLPVYYSEAPEDLPIEIAPEAIVPIGRLPRWASENRLDVR